MINDFDDRPWFVRLKQLRDKMYRSGNMWDGARFIVVEVPLDPKAAKWILPWGMKPEDPATGFFFIVDYPKTSFDIAYKEAALLVRVKTPLGRGVHCPWMVVDDDTAMIYGREGLGYPKKMAEFEFEEGPDRVMGTITRRGVTVLRLEGSRGENQKNPEPLFARKTFNVGGPGQFLGLNPIWMFKPLEVIHESWDLLDAAVALEPSESDPLSQIVSGPAAGGRFVVLDIPGAKYILPVGLAGLRHYANTTNLRYR